MIRKNSIIDIRIKDVKTYRAHFNVHTRQWMGYILLAADMFSFFLVIFIAMQARPIMFLTNHSPYKGIFFLLGVTVSYMFLRRGLYPPVGMHYADELRHIVTTITFPFLIMIGVSFVFNSNFTDSILVLTLAWVMSLPLIPFTRYVVRRLFIHLGLWGESVLIVGDLQKAHSVADYFKTSLQYGFLPVAVLSNQPRSDDLTGACPLLPICRIKVFARNLSVKTAMIVVDDFNDLSTVVKQYRDAFQWIILIQDKFENYGLTFLKPLDFLDVLGLQVKNNLVNESTQVFKRMVDVILSLVALLLLAPFLTLIAIMIKWESGGDVFYRQGRLGKNGQIFNLLKFRTMYQNAAEILKEQLAHNPELKQEWDRYQKLIDDPRITRAGRFLRRFSLDELPQLWNVLKGEMSLVGPRPILVDQRELYGETLRECFQVAPGLTGLWQVSGRSQTTFARRAELDLEYIQRWSIWLDIYILFKTIKVVIWQEGAY